MRGRIKDSGFTLIEVMIVVFIIGFLLAIAIPNFVMSRETGRAKSCVSNLRALETAKQQWALDTKQSSGATPLLTDLTPAYLRTFPACPSGGSYTISDIGTTATCTITGVAGSGYATGEKWYHGLP